MTLPAQYFDDLYAATEDPWGFRDRWYEKRKRALTLALLPAPRYNRVFEPGCSIGVLTHDLAGRCASLLATDLAASAVDAATARCAHLAHVRVELATHPLDWPGGSFDLVVLSEVLYYFSSDDVRSVAQQAFSSTGTLLAVHWRHPVADYPLTGDAVHEVLEQQALLQGMQRLAHYLDEDLVADVWSRDGRSVATRTGLT